MYKLKVNKNFEYEIEVKNDQVTLNNKVVELDVEPISNRRYHILHNHKSYEVELVSEQKEEKTMVIKVNGRVYHVDIEDQYDQLLSSLGLNGLADRKLPEIKAPMPGLVLSILALEGQEIEKGDNLLVLEAMKMENMIKSPTHGVIEKVLIRQGDKVEKNQVLIQFRPD
jgi:biotin carboxyl carrier protein